MFADIMNSLYLMLYIVPFTILRYYPFLDRLRIPLKNLCIIYGTLLLIQITSFKILHECDFWSLQYTQFFRLAFAALYALLSFVVIKEQFFKHFFIYLMMFMYSALVSGNAHIIEAYINRYYFHTPAYVIINIVMVVQLMLTYPFVFTFLKRKILPLLAIKNADIWNYIWAIPMMFIAFGILFGINLSPDTIINWKHSAARYLAFLGVFSSCFILMKILKQTDENATLNENMRMSNKLLMAQANHYKMLTDNINKARAARHDLHHHILVLQSYLHNNQLDLLEEYLNKYKVNLAENINPMLCNHYIVDAIIQHYITIAEELKVTFTATIFMPANVSINDLDLCIILGNAIENAIEACRRMTNTDQFIKLNIKIIGNMLIITIDNSYNGIVKATAASFISSKRDGSDEGIGIASIKSVANKYNGIVKFDFTKDVFKTSIMLTLKN